jgi:hypothetical protein
VISRRLAVAAWILAGVVAGTCWLLLITGYLAASGWLSW